MLAPLQGGQSRVSSAGAAGGFNVLLKDTSAGWMLLTRGGEGCMNPGPLAEGQSLYTSTTLLLPQPTHP